MCAVPRGGLLNHQGRDNATGGRQHGSGGWLDGDGVEASPLPCSAPIFSTVLCGWGSAARPQNRGEKGGRAGTAS